MQCKTSTAQRAIGKLAALHHTDRQRIQRGFVVIQAY